MRNAEEYLKFHSNGLDSIREAMLCDKQRLVSQRGIDSSPLSAFTPEDKPFSKVLNEERQN